MPDFNSLIAKSASRAEQKSTQSQSSDVDPIKQAKEQQIKQEELSRVSALRSTSLLTEEEKQTQARDLVNQNQAPYSERLTREQEVGTDTQGNVAMGADKTMNDFATDTAKNLLAGFGSEVVGSTGQVIEMLGAGLGINDYYSGNWLGNTLQEWGAEMEAKGTRLPDELLDPDISWQTISNPKFWSNTMARLVPQLAEFILLSKGAGSAVKFGLNQAGKAAAKTGVSKFGRQTLKATSKAARTGAKETTEELGKGIAAFTDEGLLTTAGAAGAETFGAGAGGNLFVGVLNAADTYQSRAEMTGPDGQPLYSEEELAEMAAGTFQRNLYYLPIDVLSWGMTFGKGKEVLRGLGIGSKSGAKGVTNLTKKAGAKAFAKRQAYGLKPLQRFAQKPFQEGLEESFQETYEEWSSLRAFEDATGAKPKYGDGSITNFWDFYKNRETEAIRVVSAAMGAVGGGAGNIMVNDMNENAERERQLYDRVTNLKTILDETDEEGNSMRKFHLRSMASDAILNDQVDGVSEFINHQVSKGTLTENDLALYDEVLQDYQELNNQADVLNIRGKVALFKNHTTEKVLQEEYDRMQTDLVEQISVVQSMEISDEAKQQKIAFFQNKFKKESTGVAYGIAQANSNKSKLVLGEKITKDVDVQTKTVNGQTFKVANLTNVDYDYYVKDSDEDIRAGKGQNAIQKSKSFLDFNARKIYDKIVETFTPDKETDEDTQEPVQQEETPAEETVETPTEETATPEKETAQAEDTPVSEIDNLIKKNEESIGKADQGIEAVNKRLANQELSEEERKTSTDRLQRFEEIKKERQDQIELLKAQREEAIAEQEEAAAEMAETPVGKESIEDIEGINPEASDTVSKAKPESDNGVNPKVASTIAQKIAEKIKLGKKEQALYDQFKNTIDQVRDRIAESGNRFVKKLKSKEFKDKLKRNEKLAKEQSKKAKKKGKELLAKGIEASKKLGIVRDNIFSEEDITGEPTKTPETINPESEAIYNETKVHDFGTIGRLKYGPDNVDIMMAVNERIDAVFPNLKGQKPRVVILDDLAKAIGMNAVGYSIGATVYVQANKWNQGDIFMHEFAHIYYRFAQNEPETKAVIKEALKNVPVVQRIIADYKHRIYYKVPTEFGDVVQFLPKEYLRLTQQELKDIGVVRMPLEQQPILLEEIFAHYLQGPMSQKYNSFFAPKEELKRQRTSTGWWNSIANRVKSAEAEQGNIDLIKKIEDDGELAVENMRDYIVQRFKERTEPIPYDDIGYHSMKENYDAVVGDEKIAIIKETQEQNANYVENPLAIKHDPLTLSEEELLESDITEEQSENDLTENSILGNIITKSFESIGSEATKVLSQFIKEYNKAVRLKSVYGIRVPAFDRDVFLYTMYDAAKYSVDAPSFMQMLDRSTDPAVLAFQEFLKIKAPGIDKVLLSSMYSVLHNHEMVNAVNHRLGYTYNYDTGKTEYQFQSNEALSLGEAGRLQGIMNNMEKGRQESKAKLPTSRAKAWERFEKNIEAIERGNPTDKQFYQAWKYLGVGGNIKIGEILMNNVINYKGEYFTPGTFLNSFVNSKEKLHRTNKGKGFISAYNFKPVITALIATNREFTPYSMVQNAKNNSISVRIINNNLTKEMNQLQKAILPNSDGVIISKADFIKKFSHVTGNKKYKGTDGNQFLSHYYDKAITGEGVPSMVYYGGIDDTVSQKGTTYDGSTAYEQSFEDFMEYAISGNKNTYRHNMGVLGDSPRKFYMPTKKLKYKDHFISNRTGPKVDPSSSQVKAAYDIYRNLDDNAMSYTAFIKNLNDNIAGEIAFMNANGDSMSRISNIESYFGENKRLNTSGKKLVGEYVLNTMANGMFMAEVFAPNINLDKLDKRFKNAGSPVMSINENLRFEPLIYMDEILNGTERTDGGMYILEEDAKRWANMGLGVFDLNNGFKFLNFSVEKDNPNFKGQTMLLKGYTTVLTEDEVRQNPGLQGVYDMLKKRNAKYAEQHNKKYGHPPTQNFNDGLPNSFSIAIPYSSVKDNKAVKGLKDQLKTPTQLNNPALSEEANQLQDKLFYDGRGPFLGLSAYNFGPQQVMDKMTSQVTLPIQQINALLSAANIVEDRARGEAIQALYAKDMKAGLDAIVSKIKSEEGPEGYKEFIDGLLNKELIDPVQYKVIKDYGILHRRGHQLIVNTLANALKKAGNRLQVPGTWAQQKSDFGYKLPNGAYVNGTNELNHYTVKGNGDTRASEAVLPKRFSIANGGQVTGRQYFTINNEAGKKVAETIDQTSYFDSSKTPQENDLIGLEKLAQKSAKRQGKEVRDVFDQAGNKIGYYVPGDQVLATRVPSNGPAFTGVFEAVDFTTTDGNNIQVPSAFTATIGADLDGDSLFIQHMTGKKDTDAAIQATIDLWLSKGMRETLTTEMNTSKESTVLKNAMKKVFPEQAKPVIPFTPEGRRKSYNDSQIASRNIGIIFNLHKTANVLRAYDTEIVMPFQINSNNYNVFNDDPLESGKTKLFNSSLVANLILDNLSNQTADALNINEHTINTFGLLTNLGIEIEDIGYIMNLPLVKEYVNILNENNSAYHGYTKTAEIKKKLAESSKYVEGISNNVITKPTDENFRSIANQSAVIDLMEHLGRLNEEIQAISKIMSGHKGIETNPFMLEQQLEKANEILTNEKKDQNLFISSALRNNPDIQKYLTTANAVLKYTKELDPAYRPAIQDLFEKLNSTISEDGLTQNQLKKYSNTVRQFLDSRLVGTNNIDKDYFRQLTDKNNPKSVFSRLGEHMMELHEQDTLSKNLLLTRGLTTILGGNNPVISLNKSFFDRTITNAEQNQLSREFEALPFDLQLDLLRYDILAHRLDSTYSMLPTMGRLINTSLMEKINNDFKSKQTTKYNPKDIAELERIIIAKDFHGTRNNFKTIVLSDPKAKANNTVIKAMRDDSFMRNKIADNQPFYFVVKTKTKDGYTDKLYYYKGIKSPSYASSVQGRADDNLQRVRTGIVAVPDVQGKNRKEKNKTLDIDLITVNNTKYKPYNPFAEKKSPIVSNNEPGAELGMAAIEEYWRYNNIEPLSREEFDQAMEYTRYDNAARKENRFMAYKEAKTEANEVYRKEIEDQDLTKFSDKKITSLYEKYAQKDAYAFAIVTSPIIKEFARRIGDEQSQLTGKEQGTSDIGQMKAYFMANNLPSDHPAAGGFVRTMEQEHKNFMAEKKRIAKKVNDATDNLYDEVYGFKLKRKTPWNLFKRLYYSFFFNRKTLYDRLYGPLVNRETVYKDKTPTEQFSLKPRAEIESAYKSGQLSKAHYDFYQVFRQTTDELAPYSQSKLGLRENYIPHTNMSTFEAFANRGLLGLMLNSKSTDDRIKEVKMFMKNPNNGQTEMWTFKDIQNHYKSLAIESGNNINNIKEYITLQKKAKKLLKSHKNEDGSTLTHNPEETASAFGLGIMNRFSNTRSQKAEELPSMDLNHALLTYAHATLFVNGNQNFKGFKKLQGVLDGILQYNEQNNLTNINKYLKINWKDAYLQNKKQVLFGKPIDDAVDLATKLNLFWQLGGKVGYLVGNVIAGKYHNIKNGTVKEWAKGEARFWGLDDIKNPFDIPKRHRRAQNILKNINFLDINIYDNVSFQSANRLDNFFGDLALMPMAASEQWIQGVQMLGLLTDEEYSRFDDQGNYKADAPKIEMKRITEMENEVKNSQGKGYQLTDQRAIQQYSLGRMFMQFARFIPTMFHDRFAKQDTDIYGKEHIGSLRALQQMVLEVQSMNPKDYIAYRTKLQKTNPDLARRLDSGLKGFTISGLVGAYAIYSGNQLADASYWDSNYYWDYKRLMFKMKPSAVRGAENMLDSIF